MLPLGAGLVVVSWFEGDAAARFGILDTRDGSWKRGKGVSGVIQDAVGDPSLDRAWLLCSYGLFEIELSTATVTRRLRRGLGTHQSTLTPLGNATVGVSSRFGKTVAVVSTESMELVGRMRVPAPDVTVGDEASRLFMSFQAGLAREAHHLAPSGKSVAIPRAASALAIGAHVAYLPSRESTYGELHPLGSIAWYDTTRMRSSEVGPDVGATRLLAHTADGHLLASEGDRGLLVLDATGRDVVERVNVPAGVVDVIPLASEVLLWQGRPHQWPHITVLAGVAGTSGASPLAASTTHAEPIPPSSTSARKATELQLEGHTLWAGESLSGITAERITLLDCRTEITDDPEARPVIRDLNLRRLRMRRSQISGAVIEDLTIEGLDTDIPSGFVRGCEIRRVTLRGRVGPLSLFPEITKYRGHEREWEVHRALYERRLQDPEWMLDLRDARGPIYVRGHPSRFFLLNPEIHAVVPFENAISAPWRDIDFGRSHFSVTLDDLVRYGWEDATLIANPRDKHFADELRVIAELRERGIANA